MAAGRGREGLQRPVHVHERREGDSGSVYQCEADTPLTRGHPFRDDDPGAIGPCTQEGVLSGEGGDMLTFYSERPAIERVPGIVDGDRA